MSTIAMTRASTTKAAFPALFGALVVACVVSAGIGALHISPSHVLAAALDGLGVRDAYEVSATDRSVLFAIRFPRIALAVMVGASLGMCGASLQGLFRNPLSDPGVLGVSPAAALAAAAFLVLGPSLPVDGLAPWLLPIAAFVGALAATAILVHLARRGAVTHVATMLLVGLGITSLSGAGIGLFSVLASDSQMRSLQFFTLGSLNGATWETVVATAPFVAIPALALPRLARSLDAIALGEQAAAHVGVDVERVKRQIVILVCLSVGACVAATGVIGFVGLVVPHVVRLAISPSHRALVPIAGITGSVTLVLADAVARTALAPIELPIGIVTALAGAPFFIALVVTKERHS